MKDSVVERLLTRLELNNATVLTPEVQVLEYLWLPYVT